MSVFKGMDTFESLVVLLRDPVALDSMLSNIKSATKAYEEAIQNVTELSKVDQYIQEVTKARTEIELKKKESAELADNLVRKATEHAQGLRQKAEMDRKEAQFKLAEATSRFEAIEKQEQELEKRLKNIQTKEDSLRKREAELVALQQEVEERKKKLLAAIQ